MADVPRGATIVKKELTNEAGDKLREIKKASKFSDFLEAMRKAEEENFKPLSSDLEVIEGIDVTEPKGRNLLKELGDTKRIVGWNPKTGTALVKKLTFMEKASKKRG